MNSAEIENMSLEMLTVKWLEHRGEDVQWYTVLNIEI